MQLSTWKRLPSSKNLRNFFHSSPMDTWKTLNITNETFQHHKNLRSSTNIGVNGDRKYCKIIFSINPVKLISPEVFDISRIHKAMTVWSGLDEHHWWKVVHIPVGWNLNQVYTVSSLQWLHPVFSWFAIIYIGPFLSCSGIVRLEIMMPLTVIILETIT